MHYSRRVTVVAVDGGGGQRLCGFVVVRRVRQRAGETTRSSCAAKIATNQNAGHDAGEYETQHLCKFEPISSNKATAHRQRRHGETRRIDSPINRTLDLESPTIGSSTVTVAGDSLLSSAIQDTVGVRYYADLCKFMLPRSWSTDGSTDVCATADDDADRSARCATICGD